MARKGSTVAEALVQVRLHKQVLLLQGMFCRRLCAVDQHYGGKTWQEVPGRIASPGTGDSLQIVLRGWGTYRALPVLERETMHCGSEMIHARAFLALNSVTF